MQESWSALMLILSEVKEAIIVRKLILACLLLIAILSGCVAIPPLMSAADKGDLDAANALLDKGADVNEWVYGTALTAASVRGNTDMVKLLIDRGADVNAMSAGGFSPLGLAAEHGHADIVEILIAKGADVDRAITGMEQRLISVANLPDIVAKVKHGINLIGNNARWVYLSNEQYQKAINAFKQAISLDPSNSHNFRALGMSYYGLEQYDEAINATKRAIELNPQDAGAYDYLGMAYGNMKQYAEMSKAFKKSIELDPQNATHYASLGWFLLLKGDAKESVTYLKKAVELEPDNKLSRSVLYIPYYLQGQYDDALDAVNKSINLDVFTGVGIQIGVVNKCPVLQGTLESGPAKKAGLLIGDRITKIDGEKTKEFTIERVFGALRGKEGTRVVLTIEREASPKPFEIAVTRERIINTGASTGIGYRSLILRQMGKQEEALKDAKHSYSLNSSNVLAQLSLGASNLDHGQYAEAVKLLSQIARIDARILEATAYAKQGEMKEAATIYRSIPEEELSPKNIPLTNDRMVLLQTLKPIVKGHRDKARSFESKGHYIEALSELSEAMKVADDTELQDIQETLFSMIRMNPSLSELPEEARKYVVRAQMLKEEGNFEQAAAEFRKAIQIAPYVAGLYYDCALMNAELKKFPEAIRYMNIYLKAAPDARDAKNEILKWEFKMERGE